MTPEVLTWPFKPSTFGLSATAEPVGRPSAKAEQPKKTAEPTEQISEQAKRNRRLAASLLTRGFGAPRLGKAGLLGLDLQDLP